MFSRLQDPFIEVNKAKVESLVVPRSLSTYLATIELLPRNPVFTEAFKMVADACRENHTVGIQGGKGCGKTFILLVLFILCWSEDKNCLYLTLLSFHSDKTCKKYIREFVAENNYIDSVDKDKILKEEGSLSMKEIMTVSRCLYRQGLLAIIYGFIRSCQCPRKPHF